MELPKEYEDLLADALEGFDLENDGATSSHGKGSIFVSQLCADTDATQQVWNGALTRIDKSREACTVRSDGSVHSVWSLVAHGRFNTNQPEMHYIETRRDDDDVRQILHTIDKDQFDKNGLCTTGKDCLDTVWKLMPATMVCGKEMTAKGEIEWCNERMLKYGIIGCDRPHPDGTGDINTNYVSFLHSLLLCSFNCAGSEAYASIDESGEVRVFGEAAAWSRDKDGEALDRKLHPKPAGVLGRCEVQLFDGKVPMLRVKPTPLKDAKLLRVDEVERLVDPQLAKTTDKAFEGALYQKLVQSWALLSAQDEPTQKEILFGAGLESADLAFAVNSIRATRIDTFFAALKKTLPSREDAAYKHGVVDSAKAAAYCNPRDWHSGKGEGKSFAGHVTFDNYNTGTFWSHSHDDAFVHFLDDRVAPSGNFIQYAGLLQALQTVDGPWAHETRLQATAHSRYLMRRKYVAHPNLLGTSDRAEYSIEVGVGALLTCAASGAILSALTPSEHPRLLQKHEGEDDTKLYTVVLKKASGPYPEGQCVFFAKDRWFAQDEVNLFAELPADCTFVATSWPPEGVKYSDFTFTRQSSTYSREYEERYISADDWPGEIFEVAEDGQVLKDKRSFVAELTVMRNSAIKDAEEDPVGDDQILWEACGNHGSVDRKIKDYAGEVVEGVAGNNWAGHCDAKAAFESWSIVPAYEALRVVVIELSAVSAKQLLDGHDVTTLKYLQTFLRRLYEKNSFREGMTVRVHDSDLPADSSRPTVAAVSYYSPKKRSAAAGMKAPPRTFGPKMGKVIEPVNADGLVAVQLLPKKDIVLVKPSSLSTSEAGQPAHFHLILPAEPKDVAKLSAKLLEGSGVPPNAEMLTVHPHVSGKPLAGNDEVRKQLGVTGGMYCFDSGVHKHKFKEYKFKEYQAIIKAFNKELTATTRQRLRDGEDPLDLGANEIVGIPGNDKEGETTLDWLLAKAAIRSGGALAKQLREDGLYLVEDSSGFVSGSYPPEHPIFDMAKLVHDNCFIDGGVIAHERAFTRFLCHMPTRDFGSDFDEKFNVDVDEKFNSWLHRANGMVYVSTHGTTAQFVADCFHHAFHGLKPLNVRLPPHADGEPPRELRLSSAALMEVIASIVDFGDDGLVGEEAARYKPLSPGGKLNSDGAVTMAVRKQRSYFDEQSQSTVRRLEGAFASDVELD